MEIDTLLTIVTIGAGFLSSFGLNKLLNYGSREEPDTEPPIQRPQSATVQPVGRPPQEGSNLLYHYSNRNGVRVPDAVIDLGENVTYYGRTISDQQYSMLVEGFNPIEPAVPEPVNVEPVQDNRLLELS